MPQNLLTCFFGVERCRFLNASILFNCSLITPIAYCTFFRIGCEPSLFERVDHILYLEWLLQSEQKPTTSSKYVAGEPCRPSGMLTYWNELSWGRESNFLFGVKLVRSRVVIYLAGPRLSINSSTRGMDHTSKLDTSFNILKLLQNLQVPLGFGTKTTNQAK